LYEADGELSDIRITDGPSFKPDLRLLQTSIPHEAMKLLRSVQRIGNGNPFSRLRTEELADSIRKSEDEWLPLSSAPYI
jgi:hypothetical protein